MTDPAHYASFLLRLWHDSPFNQKAWQGEIEHIQTGQRMSVTGAQRCVSSQPVRYGAPVPDLEDTLTRRGR